MTGIHLRAKRFPLAFFLFFFAPKVSINGGAPQQAKWGDNSIPLPPGRYEISCWFDYFFGPANRATIVVDVQPGSVVPITYRSRWVVFIPGKIAIEGTAPATLPPTTLVPAPQPPSAAGAPLPPPQPPEPGR
jgi:hypothetical protein